MSWPLGRLAGFDLETTGIDVETDRIVTACVVEVVGGEAPITVNWMADPGIEIPEGAEKVHGISTERARAEGQQAEEVVAEVIDLLRQAVMAGRPIVAMNAAFDLTMLDREARRHGHKTLTDLVGDELRVVDPFVLDKAIDKYRRGGRTLTDLCRHYRVALDGAHSADADAIAACRVAWRIASRYPRIASTPLEELHEQQVGWAREQGGSFAAYLRRIPDRAHEADGVRTDWPFIPHQRGESA
jgi:DNA polymerase-3 subunit epsilon